MAPPLSGAVRCSSQMRRPFKPLPLSQMSSLSMEGSRESDGVSIILWWILFWYISVSNTWRSHHKRCPACQWKVQPIIVVRFRCFSSFPNSISESFRLTFELFETCPTCQGSRESSIQMMVFGCCVWESMLVLSPCQSYQTVSETGGTITRFRWF